MSLAWFPPSETEQDFGKRELSAYEQYLEEQRQERELKKQLRKCLSFRSYEIETLYHETR